MKIICIISSKGFELKIQKKKLRTKSLRENRQKKKRILGNMECHLSRGENGNNAQ